MNQRQSTAINRGGFIGDQFARFVKHVPALTMTCQTELDIQILEHFDGYFTRKRAVLFEIHVLRAQKNARRRKCPSDCIEINKRRRGTNLNIRRRTGGDSPGKLDRLRLNCVHLPVAGDKFRSRHSVSVSYWEGEAPA